MRAVPGTGENRVMRTWIGVLSAALLSTTIACGDGHLAAGTGGTTGTAGSPGVAGTTGPAGTTGSAGTTGAAGSGGGDDASELLYTGAVVVHTRVEISAPILPRTSVIYAAFPATLEGEQEMAHAAALTFEWLLPKCAPLYPQIVLDPAGGANLTPEQLHTNYDQVGQCSYEQYSAKPYWIPKLVKDVDICGTELGPGWRLISEADLAQLGDLDRQRFLDTLGDPAGAAFFATYFVAPQVWVRAADGSIKAGSLAPGASGVTALGVPDESTTHYEGWLALRCIRRS